MPGGVPITGAVGPQSQTSAGDGTPLSPYQGRQGQLVVQDFLPRYAEAAYRGLLFNGANQAGQAITNLAAAATGLILINPLGSGKNLWLVDMVVSMSSAEASTLPVVTLAANSNPLALSSYTLTTPLTINAALVGSTNATVAKLLSSATLPAAPAIVRSIWGVQSFGTVGTTAVPNPQVKDEVSGAIGISPGCAISLSSSAALSAIASFTWMEIPV
jgi:hypothetical protein